MYLISQMLIYLLLAATLGFLVAMAFGLCNCNKDELNAELNGARAERDELAARLAARSDTSDRDGARAASLAGVGAVSNEDHATLKARNDFLEARVKFLEEKKPVAKPKVEKPSKSNFVVSAAGAMSADELETAVLAEGDGKKPKSVARGKDADDLLLIDGVGPKNNEWLKENGIHYFWQIATMNPSELAWLSNNLPNFGSRVYRENWVSQCANLAKGLAAR